MLRDTSGQDTVLETSVSPKRKYAIIALLMLAVLVALTASMLKFNRLFASDMSIDTERLRFAQVTRGDLLRDIAVQGRVVAANSPTLYANSGGIVSLHVKAGDTVDAEQVLAVVESPELKNQLAQELATLEQLKLQVGRQDIQIKSARLNNRQAIEVAEVELESAQVEKQRAEISVADSLISQREFEQKTAEFKRASLVHKHATENYAIQEENMALELRGMQSQLARQQHVVHELHRQIAQLTLKAPTGGVIGSVYVREKDNVSANSALITVVDLSVLEIEAAIPENFADDMGVGLAAMINVNGVELAGQLVAISPEVSNGQVEGRIRFNEQAAQQLRQNQRVNARILIESKHNVLKIQRGEFLESGGSRIAYRVEQDNAHRQSVQFGARSITEVEVLSGLQEGDTIIISNISQFREQSQLYLIN
ncbi:efflux RND transporter periplasmic adaptor subunit [Planctobacterium marinum]|uniref:RND transporter MFP subunit n=1 Tax=Planctobacterium marinum TaxID=1631968 RepID=A0AA48HEG0_9ALTE|nr:RND transporter MFP subunit [Planctobacterium marinum]